MIYNLVDVYFVNAGEGYVNITSPMDPIRVASLGWGLPDPKTGRGESWLVGIQVSWVGG